MRRARPLLGTIVEISTPVYDPALAGAFSAAFSAAFAAVERVQQLMSFHDDGSDVSRINAAGIDCAVSIDPQTFHVLRRAKEIGDLSGGAFDIATADVLVRSGFLPQHESMPVASIAASYRDLDLSVENCVRWRRKGWIDLGGIAKGYAVDCAIAALREHGVTSATVNAGGDLRCFGAAQPIHVRRPHAPDELVFIGYLSDCAIATSSGYFSGKTTSEGRIDALVDPERHVCTAWNESVSVIASDCMTADALTKMTRLNPQLAPALLATLNAQAVLINEYGITTCGTPRLRENDLT